MTVGGSSEQHSEAVCRICYGEGSCSDIVEPCACRGSVRWVHKSCLQSWQRLLVSQGKVARATRCDLCHEPYRGKGLLGVQGPVQGLLCLPLIAPISRRWGLLPSWELPASSNDESIEPDVLGTWWEGEGEERAGVADRLLAVSRQRRSLADSSAPPTRPQTPGPPSLLAVTEAAEDGLPWGAAASRPESRNFRSLLRRCYRLLSRLPIVGPAWRATVRMAIAFSRAVARTAYSVGALRVLGFCAEAFLMAATVTAGVQAALRACPAALAEVSRCLGNGGGELKGRLAQGLLHAGCLIGMYALTRLGVALVRYARPSCQGPRGHEEPAEDAAATPLDALARSLSRHRGMLQAAALVTALHVAAPFVVAVSGGLLEVAEAGVSGAFLGFASSLQRLGTAAGAVASACGRSGGGRRSAGPSVQAPTSAASVTRPHVRRPTVPTVRS